MAPELWAVIIASAAPLLSALWVVHNGRRSNSIVDTDRRKQEIEHAVASVREQAAQETRSLRQQVAEEKQECKETTAKLEARVERYEQRTHTAETQNAELRAQLSELRGKQMIMERLVPQIDILASYTRPGGRRQTDPPKEHAHGNRHAGDRS